MMSYENENNDALFEPDYTDEVAPYNSDDEEQYDNISQRCQDSDTEQEWSDNDHPEDLFLTNGLYYTGKDKVTKWSLRPIIKNFTIKSGNITLQKPGVNLDAQNARTELECWNHFITNSMLDEILCHTNTKIKQSLMNNPTRNYLLKETTKEELLAFFGLIYLAGLTHTNRQNLQDLWRTDGTGMDIFRTTMTLERFSFLNRSLVFDDLETYIERKRVDNFASIRSIFETFVANCENAYTPSEYLTIDTTLIAFGGRRSLRQCIMNKRVKSAIKMYTLVDAKSFYTVNLEIDSGKQSNGPFIQCNKAFYIVDRLVKPFSKSNRNITIDKWFTSIPLVTHLQKKHNLTCTGLLCKNKRQIPPNFKTVRNRKLHSSRFAFRKDMTLVSYVPKKSKVILVVSSLHHDGKIDQASGNKRIPKIISFYNSTKADNGAIDELYETYDITLNSKRWPTTVFFTIMKIAAMNSFILYRENNKSKRTTRDFFRKLGLSMLQGYLHTTKNVKKHIRATMDYSSHEKKRCKVCPSAKDKKSRYKCNKCQKPICMNHAIPICQNCIDSVDIN